MILLNSYWNEANDQRSGWIKSFCRILRHSKPISITGESILLSSDYSGDLTTSKYSIYSILVTDLDKIILWEISRRQIRKEYGLKNRTMSYKGLNDQIKLKALPAFLDAANLIRGFCVNIVVDKKITDLVDKSTREGLMNEKMLSGKWKRSQLDKMIAICQFLAVVLGGVVKPRQNIYWYSDEDDIFSNELFKKDVAMLLSTLTSYYVKVPLGEAGIGTTSLNEQDNFEEDMNSIPDLIAGALNDFFNNVHYLVSGTTLRDFAYPFPKNMSFKTSQIIEWIGNPNTLQNITIVFDSMPAPYTHKVWCFGIEPDPRF